jgi:hypothetical protein
MTIYRFEVAVTLISYLVVACKDPGYVTSYVLRGDEFEDDLEQAKKEIDDNIKFNDMVASRKKSKKAKRVRHNSSNLWLGHSIYEREEHHQIR